MTFNYKASSKDGIIQTGLIDANSTSEAAILLKNQNLLPITISENAPKSLLSFSIFKSKPSRGDLIVFTRQLSSMMGSGLTIMQGLNVLKDQMQNEQMQALVGKIISDIEEGKSFASALENYPELFSPIYISLIKAGESSGFLDKILLRLADTLEKDQKLRDTIKGALLYPAIVIILMIVVVILMMLFVIPPLSILYKSLNVSLPFTTQVLVGLSNFTIAYWWVMAVGLVATILIFRKWKTSKKGSLAWDGFVLKVPIFGNLIRKSILVEFSRTLGLLIGAGSLVVPSMRESADVAHNQIYKKAILEISRHIEKGVSISDAMAVYDIFPPILPQMIKIGEQTGKLDESLLKVSEYFEREVEQIVKTLTTAMEPFIIIVLGIGVTFLVISIITPIYSLTSAIK